MMIGQRRPSVFEEPMAPMSLDVPQVALPQAAPRPEHKLNWGAIIADALSGLAGQQGQYPQRVARESAEQTEFERGEQRYQRERADGRDDFLWKQQNENRAPTGFAAELIQAGYQPGSEEYVAKLQQRITNQLDPFVTAPLPNGVYSGPRSGIASLAGGGPMNTNPKPPPPQSAIEELRHDPSAAAEFDGVFGEGAAARALGGAGSPAPRGFR